MVEGQGIIWEWRKEIMGELKGMRGIKEKITRMRDKGEDKEGDKRAGMLCR